MKYFKHVALLALLIVFAVAARCPTPGEICHGYQDVLVQFYDQTIPQVDELVSQGLITGPLLEEYETYGKGQTKKAIDDLLSICQKLDQGQAVDYVELTRSINQGNAGMSTVIYIVEQAGQAPMVSEWKAKIQAYQKRTAKKLLKGDQ